MRELNLHGGIDYREYPPPPTMWKASRREWAEQLVKCGKLYLTNTNEFRHDDDPERGDGDETVGIYKIDERDCRKYVGNEIFLWCASLEACPSNLLGVFGDCDVVVEIRNTEAFLARVRHACSSVGYASLAAGSVSYDKSRKSELTEFILLDGIFQKEARQAAQREYRLALTMNATNPNVECPYVDHMQLDMGDCSDLAAVVFVRA